VNRDILTAMSSEGPVMRIRLNVLLDSAQMIFLSPLYFLSNKLTARNTSTLGSSRGACFSGFVSRRGQYGSFTLKSALSMTGPFLTVGMERSIFRLLPSNYHRSRGQEHTLHLLGTLLPSLTPLTPTVLSVGNERPFRG
jgi:hypothetical protein